MVNELYDLRITFGYDRWREELAQKIVAAGQASDEKHIVETIIDVLKEQGV